jgi:hypothetical protein
MVFSWVWAVGRRLVVLLGEANSDALVLLDVSQVSMHWSVVVGGIGAR